MQLQERRQELRKTLKKKKLTRVLNPEAGETVHAIVEQNEMFARMRDMRHDIPDDHKQEIGLIRREERLDKLLREHFATLGVDPSEIKTEPRAIKALNLLERLKDGRSEQWSARANALSDLVSLLGGPAPSETVH